MNLGEMVIEKLRLHKVDAYPLEGYLCEFDYGGAGIKLKLQDKTDRYIFDIDGIELCVDGFEIKAGRGLELYLDFMGSREVVALVPARRRKKR